jgi:hypothetical protein
MSNEKQQTAVEWQYIELSKFLTGFSEFTHKSDILIKAKEMEKEQIKEAYFIGGHQMKNNKYIGMHEYYNETYGGNK